MNWIRNRTYFDGGDVTDKPLDRTKSIEFVCPGYLSGTLNHSENASFLRPDVYNRLGKLMKSHMELRSKLITEELQTEFDDLLERCFDRSDTTSDLDAICETLKVCIDVAKRQYLKSI